jgi:hypothetical protein
MTKDWIHTCPKCGVYEGSLGCACPPRKRTIATRHPVSSSPAVSALAKDALPPVVKKQEPRSIERESEDL